MKQPYISPEELKERLNYDPETGKLTWKKCHSSKRIGKEAKTLDVAGYIQVNVRGSVLKGHRIAWAIHYGSWPEGHIDHINGNRIDNRISNLRCVDSQTNCQNKRNGSTKNKTGYIGVWESSVKEKKFRAKIVIGKKQIHLGGFKTADEAHQAYVDAKRKLHAGCTI